MGAKWVLCLLCLVSSQFLLAINGDYPTANLSSSWISNRFFNFNDGSSLSLVLIDTSNDSFPAVGCGFYSKGNDLESVFFVTFVIATRLGVLAARLFPTIIWSANRANPVKMNATLGLTSEGDLVLRDADGTLTWSTNTAGKSVIGMKITLSGNLMLYDSSNSIVWQSIDHPTNCWLPGQNLTLGQKLVSSVSATNWSEGPFSLSFSNSTGLSAFVEANPSQKYWTLFDGRRLNYPLEAGRLELSQRSHNDFVSVLYVSETEYFQYMRLESDGHLRVYQWVRGIEGVADDVLTGMLQNCTYPTVCGNYGICSIGADCSCPFMGKDGDSSYLRPVSLQDPSLGCAEVTPLSCESPNLHLLLEIDNVMYFEFVTDLADTDVESCKEACLKKCSCKAALFQYGLDASSGDCYLPSQIFSITRMPILIPTNWAFFIKVQKATLPVTPNPPPFIPDSPPITLRKRRVLIARVASIMGLILAGSFVLGLLIWICLVNCKRKHLWDGEEEAGEEGVNSSELLPNLAKRFSYEDLKSATQNFHACRILGGGGFGSVFEGTLGDGVKVAVKRLDRLGQGRKEFLAEVKTMGTIHHVNLVKLIGFSAERSHRLLVYEYMSNGSLDKWIFDKTPETALEWEIRKKIILNIAKGLAYLHEECQEKIAHLDIKPQNILLDDNLNAKLSDFGLAKLIGKEQSQVMTQMRGTRGYLAPEWLSRKITEKADVYSFGIVMLEVICGRRNLDDSQPEENEYLLEMVKKNAEENKLSELVDKRSEDMKRNGEEAVEMMRIAIWCLHSEPTKRPCMSTVVKALEGSTIVEPILDFSFPTYEKKDYSFLISSLIKKLNEAVSQA